ncbi:Translation initiation factor IF-2-like 25, partial [Homarus americanus]
EFDAFTTDGSVLFCKYCEAPVTASKKFQVQQHLKTSKHIRLEAVKSNSAQKEQQLLLACSSKSGPDRSQFNADLCKAFVSADIPLHKLNNKCLKSFLEQYTGKKVPDESTLRKNYVSQLFNDTMEIIRRKACGKKIWVSLDETTDVEQRCIVNLIFGVLGDETERGKYYLGFEKLKKVSQIMSGDAIIDETVQPLTMSDLLCMKHAPIVSCDVERVFSEYKAMLTDNRRGFNFENLRHHVIIKCNHNLNEHQGQKKSRNEHQGQKKSRNEHQGQKKSRNEHQGQKKSRNEHQGQKKSRNEHQGQKKSSNEHQGQKKSRNEHQGQKKSRNEHRGQKKSRNEHQGQKKSRNEHQ